MDSASATLADRRALEQPPSIPKTACS